jgi:hypothetical protein
MCLGRKYIKQRIENGEHRDICLTITNELIKDSAIEQATFEQ